MKKCSPIFATPVLPNKCWPPVIVLQPKSQQVSESESLIFTVVANGSESKYQWLKDGVNIAGATNRILPIPDADLSDDGFYTVKVYNKCGDTISRAARLIVGEGPCVPPVITVNPSGGSYIVGNIKTLSVSASGTHLTYQWQKDGAIIPGANTQNLIFSNLISGDTGVYSVIVSNSCGTIVSTDANLIVNALPVANAGTDQSITLPTSTGNLIGSFSYDTDGVIVSYLWTRVSGPGTYTITNPNAANTTVTGLGAGTHVFNLLVTDNYGGSGSDTVTINVAAAVLFFTIGWSSTDPYVDDLTAPAISNGQSVAFTTGDNLIFTGGLINFADKYIVWRIPASEPTPVLWSNGDPLVTLNQGIIPDDGVIRPIFTVGGYKYAVSRNPMALDTGSDLRLLH